MGMKHLIAVAMACLSASVAHAQSPLVTRATLYVGKNPSTQRLMGLAEILRVHASSQAGLDNLQKAVADLPVTFEQAAELQEFVCWRMQPVPPARRDAFRQEVAKLKKVAPKNPWLFVWELQLLAGDNNRSGLLAAIEGAPIAGPTQFPSGLAEKCHLELLQVLGMPRAQAGVEIVSARNHEPLHALRDLDRALTREADYLRESQRNADATRVLQVRNHFRTAYVRAARHLVEKLFAFHLAGQTKDRDNLLAKAKSLPYLHDRRQLAELLERLGPVQAWDLVVAPLLHSELALIDNPPNLGSLPPRLLAQMQIKARKKTVHGNTTEYEGDVRFHLHAVDITCAKLTLLHSGDPAAAILSGQESVRLRGLPGYVGGVEADRFVFHAGTGSYTLSGNVRLNAHDKITKLRSCSLTHTGVVRDPRSWIDDFKKSFTLQAKLDLLPQITQVYDDSELPDEVRYLLALNLLQPHLTWRAPFLPPQPHWGRGNRIQELRDVEKVTRQAHTVTFGQEALGGEAWMLDGIPESAQLAYREELKAWYARYNEESRRHDNRRPPPDLAVPEKDLYSWRLRDPKHADVLRAARLLQGIQASEIQAKARRWFDEIQRNNTVLTFDIAGAAPMGKTHSVLMDVRNAERVTFKLYRVQKPDELAFAASKIGTDFIYRDHRLDDKSDGKAGDEKVARWRDLDRSKRAQREIAVHPTWKPEQLVREWTVRVGDLKHHESQFERRSWRRWHRDYPDWHNEADADYFDDECSEHRDRLDKEYRPGFEDQLSSWQCDRIVPIPEKALAAAGAYVLVAEANGQLAHVPIVVEPISLTLRRCRDGVFVMAADADGTTPLAGASVHSAEPMERGRGKVETRTDKEGVAFARILAIGDRAIVVHHEGRYAIGGFGQVFEGIYEPQNDFRQRGLERLERARKLRADVKGDSFAYRDRHVLAAYTDRPTYRPGQDVQFKLIVRKLLAEKLGDALSTAFRAQDFDAHTRMALPALDQPLEYHVLDPRGREVSQGTLRLSDFGTAAGKVTLNAEAVLGSYALRVRLAGEPRLVPEIFTVKHYRRPNIEVRATGVPATLTRPDALTVGVAAHYYFGPPVTKGTVQVRLLRTGAGKPIAEESGTLNETGNAKLVLRMPKTLEFGKYLVVSSVTDESGRTVSTASPLRLASPDAPTESAGLDKLPRFIGVGQEFRFATSAKVVLAHHERVALKAHPAGGIVTLKFPHPGWYHLKAGDEESAIFAFGGKAHPREFALAVDPDDEKDDAPRTVLPPRWVNLSDFSLEDDGRMSRWENPSHHLLALFDCQSLKVGDNLRLLVYVPQKKAKLLFTIEDGTVRDYAVRWTDSKTGPYHVIDIPIKDRYFPNVYVQGRILTGEEDRAAPELEKAKKQAERSRDEDDGRDPRWCRIDVAKPAGNPGGAQLQVQIETDRAHYRPGDTVRATVKVTDLQGKPQAAELSLAAIDESVYTFSEDRLDSLPGFFRMPDERRRFQPKVWRTSVGTRWSRLGLQSAVSKQSQALADLQKSQKSLEELTSDMAKIQLAELGQHELAAAHFNRAVPLPSLGAEMPAGQVPLARLREHFHETATWLPQLRTDSAGAAQASFTLPDSLTRYRLTSVALTKSTDVGVGRTSITAGLPLAVQVFLPRFAIEKDRVLAIALIHNSTEKDRECSFIWQIDGIDAELPNPAPADWKLISENGKFLGAGRVKVPAKGSAKVNVWLKLDRIGTARVAFRADDGKDADAEVRTLPVHPLGRPAEFNANNEVRPPAVFNPAEKQLLAKFNKLGRIQLPAGFLARELDISIAGSDVAQALAGLDYLVDYPHGCIEQTMSRFMPVVMIHHATKNTPVKLQPEIAAKLPDILAKGLTRVYGFQHADGSWGWFEKDSRNFPMSIQVVHGLARCQASGVKVDAEVLRTGSQYLLHELRTNRQDPQLASRAWYALALAGHADLKELGMWVQEQSKSMDYRPEVWCYLALACKSAGLNEQGERFWTRFRANARNWWGHDTERAALVLNTELAFGAPYSDCRDSARRLLGKRTGTYWSHTRDTAFAIEALANMLGYLPEKHTVRQIEVRLAGTTVLHVKNAEDLKKMIWRVRLKAEQIPLQEGLEVRVHSDSDEMIYLAVRATGVQRQDELAASGKRVKLNRVIETLEGAPLKGALKIGQVVRVRLKLDLTQPEDFLMIEERRGALCEFAADHLTGSAARFVVHHDFRDDRLCLFFTSLAAGAHEIVYFVRAETPGHCTVLPGSAYPMYDAAARGESTASKVAVGSP